jgi:hypothetical protein
MLFIFGSSCSCEQLFGLIKTVRSRTRAYFTDEDLEAHMKIPTAEIKHNIGRLFNGFITND